MTRDGSKNSLLLSLLLATSIGFSRLASQEPNAPEIIVEGLERVSRDEVHFRVIMTNRTDRPIFLTGINYELMGIKDKLGRRLYPVYLEQWRTKEGWTPISCMDTPPPPPPPPPPHVIKLNPGEAITDVLWVKVPMIGVCKNRIARWEGKFRFRVEYFESKKQARAYIEKLFSPRWREARAPVALSEPFEIPPTANPEH